MTKVVVTKRNGNISRVTCSGHTGYAECGEDIVCAGLSAVVQAAALGVIKVAGVSAQYSVDEGSGNLVLQLPSDLQSAKQHDCNVILETMLASVQDLSKSYAGFISVEVK